MKWLTAPFVVIGLAAAAAVFFWRRKSSTSHWAQAKDKATSAASDAAKHVKTAVGS